MKKILDLMKEHYYLIFLVAIFYFAVLVRWSTANFDYILDYDPWWFFRYAQELVQNNLIPPKWDILSYFPPGRPINFYLGWSYTIAIFYLIVKPFTAITLMKFSGLFIAFFSAACAIPAYFVGKYVTNKWGGLTTAFFGTITPIFVSRSIAGYPAADAADVFWTFATVFTMLYAIKNFKSFKDKKSWFAIALALASNWLFALNFNNSWYIYFFFLVFLPVLFVIRILEFFIYRKYEGSLGSKVKTFFKEFEYILFAIILIGIFGEVITQITSGWPFGTTPPIQNFFNAFGFLSNTALLVNISIAELQSLNVFSTQGFTQLISNIGFVPIFLMFGLVAIILYKWIKKKSVSDAEYFTIIWLLATFWLITHGIRFALLFSIAVAASAGFVIGNLMELLKGKNHLLVVTVYGILFFAMIWHLSDNLAFSANAKGLDIGQNWKDALTWLKNNADKNANIATWWDPGHIITGFTGLRVVADGAHCTPVDCVPYSINVRIQDMGRAFATNDENESVRILKKYLQLSPEDCQKVKDKFDDAVPPEACAAASEIYFIASSDLIGKYYWLSYFGTGEKHNFIQLPLSNVSEVVNGTPNIISYGNGALSLIWRDGRYVPVVNNRNVVQNLIYYENGQAQQFQFTNATDTIEGLVLIEPGFQQAIYMDSQIMNSVFTKLYFGNGQGLNHFKLVYDNGEVKIFKVSF
jgi:dolichyl-diphosphooligosaccharide--protein glycosyltransferase